MDKPPLAKCDIVRHPHDPFIDRIGIQIVDRYKTSGLSGDEWRFSYAIELWRKGKVIATRTCGSLEYAAAITAAVVQIGYAELEMDEDWETIPWEQVPDKGICCQPGCPEPATSTYALVDCYSRDCFFSKPNGEFGRFAARQFCDKHRKRGDCGLDDADLNYVVVQGKGPDGAVVDPSKESPSGFAGVVEVEREEEES